MYFYGPVSTILWAQRLRQSLSRIDERRKTEAEFYSLMETLHAEASKNRSCFIQPSGNVALRSIQTMSLAPRSIALMPSLGDILRATGACDVLSALAIQQCWKHLRHPVTAWETLSLVSGNKVASSGRTLSCLLPKNWRPNLTLDQIMDTCLYVIVCTVRFFGMLKISLAALIDWYCMQVS